MIANVSWQISTSVSSSSHSRLWIQMSVLTDVSMLLTYQRTHVNYWHNYLLRYRVSLENESTESTFECSSSGCLLCCWQLYALIILFKPRRTWQSSPANWDSLKWQLTRQYTVDSVTCVNPITVWIIFSLTTNIFRKISVWRNKGTEYASKR